jgi:2-amino-4-hydroxy-6-hydroxymethyldihydropteridine diphosphokinase
MKVTAFIGLGSNIEPRVRTMISALHRLSHSSGVRVERVSSVFQSAAHTIDGSLQPDYLNAAAMVRTNLTAEALLARCLEIEKALGRDRALDEKWSSRRIDLDILLYSASVIDRPELRVPHPKLSQRLFVLLPLAELIPSGQHLEVLHTTLGALVDRCPDRGPTTKTVVDLGNYK